MGVPSSAIGQRSVRHVGAFTGFYLALAAVGAVWTGNLEFLFYIGVVLVMLGVVWAVHRRVDLTHGALWALSAWGLAHMLGGLMPVPEAWPVHGDKAVLYSLWLVDGYLKYDHLVHAYGFGVTTWVCWQGLQQALGGSAARPTAGLMILVAAAGLGFGALNEIVEFAATLLVPETNVGGYRNTGWDLVSNLVGVCLAVGLIAGRGLPGDD